MLEDFSIYTSGSSKGVKDGVGGVREQYRWIGIRLRNGEMEC